MAFITAPDFRIRSIRWDLDRPAQSNISGWTGKRTATTNPWHSRRYAHVELAPVVGEANIRAMRSFLARCKGSLNTFRLYATEGAQNANSGVTASAAAAGATSLTLAGYTTPLLDGQMLTINGQLLEATANQAGAVVSFDTKLRKAVTAGTKVVTARPYALVYMAGSRLGYSVDAGQLYGVSFDVEEAILETDGTVPE